MTAHQGHTSDLPGGEAGRGPQHPRGLSLTRHPAMLRSVSGQVALALCPSEPEPGGGEPCAVSALQSVPCGSVTRSHPWTPAHEPPSLNRHKVGRVVTERHCTDNGLVTQI